MGRESPSFVCGENGPLHLDGSKIHPSIGCLPMSSPDPMIAAHMPNFNPLMQIQPNGLSAIAAAQYRVAGLLGGHMMCPPTSMHTGLMASPPHFTSGFHGTGFQSPNSPWAFLRPENNVASLDLRKTSIEALRLKAKEFSSGLENEVSETS